MLFSVDTPEPSCWLDELAKAAATSSSPASILASYTERVRIDNYDEDRIDRYFGVISDPMCRQLLEVLADLTSTPSECYFAVWEGYVSSRDVDLRCTFPIGTNSFRVFFGHIRDGVILADWFTGQTPNYAWPKDRRWCWISDIDLPFTYLGGPVGLADALATQSTLRGAVHVEGPEPPVYP